MFFIEVTTLPTEPQLLPKKTEESFENWPFTASFCLFYKQLTVKMFNKSCQRLDLNRGPLVLEANTLPTGPQPLPTTKEEI